MLGDLDLDLHSIWGTGALWAPDWIASPFLLSKIETHFLEGHIDIINLNFEKKSYCKDAYYKGKTCFCLLSDDNSQFKLDFK